MKPVLIMGCGYVGERVGHRMAREGRRVIAVARSTERVEALKAMGFETFQADLDTGEGLDELPMAGCLVLHSAPPPTKGGWIQEPPDSPNHVAASHPRRSSTSALPGFMGTRVEPRWTTSLNPHP